MSISSRISEDDLANSLQYQTLQGVQGVQQAYLCGHRRVRPWYRYRADQPCHQLRHARGRRLLPAPCRSCRSFRYEGSVDLLRQQRRRREGAQGYREAIRSCPSVCTSYQIDIAYQKLTIPVNTPRAASTPAPTWLRKPVNISRLYLAKSVYVSFCSPRSSFSFSFVLA